MNATGNKPRSSKVSQSEKEETEKSKPVRITLTQDEKEVLLKACGKYRHTIPAYIKSRQWEIDMLEDIIDKLS